MSLRELQRQARALLSQVDRAAAKSQSGLSVNGRVVLLYLHELSAELVTPTQLARHCDISTPAITQLLTAMENLGLVQRWHAKADRRKVLVRLTRAGAEQAADLARGYNDLDAKVNGVLSPAQIEQLTTQLAALSDALSQA